METQQYKGQNQTAAGILKNSLLAAFGLFVFGIGVYLSIQANIGVGPWDTFYLGINKATGIQYGTICVAVSFLVIGIDLLLKERIGIGMLLDAVIVGKTVDFMNWLDLVPAQQNPLVGLFLLLAAIVIMSFSQYLYMIAGLCCGPRDSLLVAIGKRLPKVPIGFISMGIMLTVFVFGWLLDGPIGLGTLIIVFLQGPIMQIAFNILKFKPTDVEHQDLIQSMKVIFRK